MSETTPAITDLRQPDIGISEWLTVAEPHSLDEGLQYLLLEVEAQQSHNTEPVCVAGWKTLFGHVGVRRWSNFLSTRARGFFALYGGSNISDVTSEDPAVLKRRSIYAIPVTENASIQFSIPIFFNFCWCKFTNTLQLTEATYTNVYFEFGVYARGR